jgi:predicted nucleic acid-binding protein
MAVLLDTNILLRSVQPHHPPYAPATSAVAALRTVAVQNLVEFWAVATRSPNDNGLGLSFSEAANELAVAKRLFQVLPESPQILPEWERLVLECQVTGKNAHDARLVAVMNLNKIKKILTFNIGDFKRFREVQVLDPRSFG